MLVLSRKRDQVICIGDHIRLTVVDIRGDKVRIGIEAPSDVSCDRWEVRQRKLADQRRAAVPTLPFPVAEATVDPEPAA